MKNMKLSGIIFLGLLVSTVVLKAQTDFRPGYIIPASGDTLFGMIDYRGDLIMSYVCKFKGADNKITEYSPDDISAFRFIDSKYYVSRELNKKKVFLEYLIKGRVNIYYMRDNEGDHFYLDRDSVRLTELKYEEGIKYIDNKRMYYESTIHTGVLNYYMQDAPKLQSRIQSLRKPEHQNLIQLAEDYHNAVCEGEQCIIYEKVDPLIKVNLEIVGGVANFKHYDDLIDRHYYQAGIIGHIWMPRTNEKLYFRTGLLYSQLKFIDGKKNFYKFPFHIEYVYPKGIIRPSLSYGLNFHFPAYRSVSFNVGANIKLNKSLFLSAFSDIEFSPLGVILPQDLIAYSINMGIVYKL